MLAATSGGKGAANTAGTTKARIERAALALFCARGVDAVTTRQIAAASGVSEGALYRHYPGKKALSQALFQAMHARLSREIADAAATSGGIEDKARAIVGAYVRIADEDWTLFSYHLLTCLRFPSYGQSAPSAQDAPASIIETIIADAMHKGELPAGEPAAKAAAALGVVLQTALHKMHGRVESPLARHEDSLARAFIAVLKS